MVSIDAIERLGEFANLADEQAIWPADAWNALIDTGAGQWCIPKQFGGQELEYPQLLAGYSDLASGCLTSCFLLSQRDAACRRLRDCPNVALAQEFLPKLANNEIFATVGIAQLTTSRQHGKPAMTVIEKDSGFVLEGLMPWVTGAPRADYFVTGGALDNGQQILCLVSKDAEGLTVDPPMELMAFQGSLTTSVHCQEVFVEKEFVLAGPVEKVMSQVGSGGPGGLETSSLALGLTQAAIRHLEAESAKRDEWQETTQRLAYRHTQLFEHLQSLAKGGGSSEELVHLRAEANHLVLQATQTALTASKGTGFLRSHPAQRWARQALFFLVWACPRPAVDATLANLLPCE